MTTWTLIVLIMGQPTVVTTGYQTEAACREALALVKPERIPSNAMRNVGEIMDARCFPAPK
jgi:hypothetical protein